MRPKTLKQALSGKLSEDELALMPSAFDMIGDIIIVEIRDEAVKHETLIGQTLLDMHKNINAVLKRAGVHEGTFRTQKLTWLAGEKRKETIYKETDCRIKLDVEQVYFSPRLSTERKRIAQLVKPGEDVLVMFSGCAPYPCVISRNSKADCVYGIEINPVGHEYGLENVRLNKLSNVRLYNGDVRESVPYVLSSRKKVIGLKSKYVGAELDKKLSEKPPIMEFYLDDGNLEDDEPTIRTRMHELGRQSMPVMLHQPYMFAGKRLNLSSSRHEILEATFECMGRLYALCKGNDNAIGFVAHPYSMTGGEPAVEVSFVRNMHELQTRFPGIMDYMYVENHTDGFFAEEKGILRAIDMCGIRNVCLDIYHFCWKNLDDDRLIRFIKALRERVKLYFHIVDADGRATEHMSMEVGKGKIDFGRVGKHLDFGVIEVCSEDEAEPVEMLSSYRRYNEIIADAHRFDRVLMPLPKGAEDFLDVALLATKKGGMIHFYDFLHEDDFHLAYEKIASACRIAGREHEIVRTVKCGQHAPRVFRICVDFVVR